MEAELSTTNRISTCPENGGLLNVNVSFCWLSAPPCPVPVPVAPDAGAVESLKATLLQPTQAIPIDNIIFSRERDIEKTDTLSIRFF